MVYNVLDEELEGYLQLVKTDTETGRINHRDTGLVAFIIQLVQCKSSVRNLDRRAGFGIGLDELQVTFQFFIQHVIDLSLIHIYRSIVPSTYILNAIVSAFACGPCKDQLL